MFYTKKLGTSVLFLQWVLVEALHTSLPSVPETPTTLCCSNFNIKCTNQVPLIKSDTMS